MANDQPTPAPKKHTLLPAPLEELRKLLGEFVDAGQIDCSYDSEGNAVVEWKREKPKPDSQQE